MNRMMTALCLLVFAAGVHAQQFRWVDKDGKVQYGDSPPPGAKATPMKPPAGPAAQPSDPSSKDGKDAKKSSGPMTPKEQEDAFRKRQQEQKAAEEKAAKAQQEAETRKRQCQDAQAALRGLESGARIARTNEKGERYFIDDDQRAKDIATQRKNVQDACKQ